MIAGKKNPNPFKPGTLLPKPEIPQHSPPKGTMHELNLIKRLNPLRKVKLGKKIGRYHGLDIMQHFPKI